MTDLMEWLMTYADRNAVNESTINGYWVRQYFGFDSPEDWINSLSNVELLRYFSRMNDGEKPGER